MSGFARGETIADVNTDFTFWFWNLAFGRQPVGPSEALWWFSATLAPPQSKLKLSNINDFPFGPGIAFRSAKMTAIKRNRIAVLMVVAVAGLSQVWGQAPPPAGQFPRPGAPQAAPQQDGAADQGEHGVARISVMQGEVSVRHGDAGELTAAAPNAPVLALDRVVTGANSRAELQFDASNM